jgi:hypothetical protein
LLAPAIELIPGGYQIAIHHLLVDEPDQALARLEESYEARAGMMVLLATDPAWDPVRVRPRFQKVQQRITSTSR